MAIDPSEKTVTETATPHAAWVWYQERLRPSIKRGLATVELHALPLCLVALAVPFLTSILHVLRAPLTHDELFTAYLSRLPDWASVWQALHDGTDVMPPLFCVITRASTRLFGTGNFGLRLPGLLGGWLMVWCVYRFTRKLAPPLYACLAALTPILTFAFERHFCNARPYGLLLGATGVALLCWQKRSALGLALALSAAVALQYFALALLGPLLLAEGVRWWQQRRWDWPLLAALCLPLLVVLAHWSLITAAVPTYASDNAFIPSYRNALGVYNFWFDSLLTPLVLTLVGWEVCRFLALLPEGRQEPSPVNRPASWEWALALGLAALPGLMTVFVIFTFQIFLRRYTIAGVLGVSLLVGLTTHWLARHYRAVGAVALLLFVLFTIRTGVRYRHTAAPWMLPAAVQAELRARNEPVLLIHPGEFLLLQANAPPELRERLWYAYDLDAVRRHHQPHLREDYSQENHLIRLSKWAPLKMIELQRFLTTHQTFLVYGAPSEGWLLAELKQRQAVITLRAWVGAKQLYQVRSNSGSGQP